MKKVTAHQKGLDAENWAALFLLLKGYWVIERRYRTPLGEIDIVARRGNTLVFAEVKMRKQGQDAAAAINSVNQERVRRAAELYLQKYPRYTVHDIRLDAIVMSPWSWPQHILNAF